MPIEGITCDQCGSSDVIEYKPNTYLCKACDHTFKYVDPMRARIDVAPQFCEEGCGNPIHYTCVNCGKMVCKSHGERVVVLIAHKLFSTKETLASLCETTIPELQSSFCRECFSNLSSEQLSSYLELALNDTYDNVRVASVYALRNLGNASAINILCNSSGEGSPAVHNSIAECLGDLKAVQAIPCLSELLFDDDYHVRNTAVKAIEVIDDISAFPALSQVLVKSGDSELRRAAIGILAEKGDLTIVEALRHSLRGDSYSEIRAKAAQGLGRLGSSSALPDLVQAIGDDSSDVRSAAAKSLVQINNRSVVPSLIDIAQKELTGAPEAVEALEQMAVPEGLDAARAVRKRWKHREELSYYDSEFYEKKHRIFFASFILGFGIPTGFLGLLYLRYYKDRLCLIYGTVLFVQASVISIVILSGKYWVWLGFWIAGFLFVLWLFYLMGSDDTIPI